MALFMSFPHGATLVVTADQVLTADRVQTRQTGGLEPSCRDVSTYADTKITIKIRFDISLCLFYSLPKEDNILLPQGSTVMVSGSKMARRFGHFGDGSLKKATTDFSPYKDVPTQGCTPQLALGCSSSSCRPTPIKDWLREPGPTSCRSTAPEHPALLHGTQHDFTSFS